MKFKKGNKTWYKWFEISNKCIYDFQQLQTIRSFGNSTFNGKIRISETDKNWQSIKKCFRI